MPLDPSLLQRIRDNDRSLTSIIFTGDRDADDLILEMCAALNNSRLALPITLNDCTIGIKGFKALVEAKGVASFEVNNCKNDDKDICAKYLETHFINDTLHSFDAAGNKISPWDDSSITSTQYIKNRPSVRENDSFHLLEHIQEDDPELTHIELYDAHDWYLYALFERLKGNTHVHSLTLKNCKIGINAIKALTDNKTITTLKIIYDQQYSPESGNFIQPGVSSSINDTLICFLAQNSKITSLTLKGIHIAAFAILQLSLNETVRYLNLSGNNISVLGARYLSSNKKLLYLDLSRNNIDDAAASEFSQNTTLYWLNLSYNNIGPDGARGLADNKTIHTLILDNNHIQDQGAIYLSKNDTLCVLSLRCNHIDDAGAIGLGLHSEVGVLYLDNNHIGNRGAKLLAKNAHIRELSIRNNSIRCGGAEALVKNKRLATLFIDKNNLLFDGMLALRENNTFTELSGDIDCVSYFICELEMQFADGLHAILSEIRPQINHFLVPVNTLGSLVRNPFAPHIEIAKKLAAIFASNYRSLAAYIPPFPQDRAKVTQLEKNKKEADELIHFCKMRDFEQVLRLLTSAHPVHPYGLYIQKRLNHHGNLMHVAVRNKDIDLLRELARYMPRYELYRRDENLLTYEELAHDIWPDMPSELSINNVIVKSKPKPIVKDTISAQAELDCISRAPELNDYYKALEVRLLTKNRAATLTAYANIAQNPSIGSKMLSTLFGIGSKLAGEAISAAAKRTMEREQSKLARWFEEEELVRILARRLAYARHSIINERFDDLNQALYAALYDALIIKNEESKNAKVFSRFEEHAFLDAEKLCAYMEANEKPENASPAECIDILLKHIMGKGFKYEPPEVPPTKEEMEKLKEALKAKDKEIAKLKKAPPAPIQETGESSRMGAERAAQAPTSGVTMDMLVEMLDREQRGKESKTCKHKLGKAKIAILEKQLQASKGELVTYTEERRVFESGLQSQLHAAKTTIQELKGQLAQYEGVPDNVIATSQPAEVQLNNSQIQVQHNNQAASGATLFYALPNAFSMTPIHNNPDQPPAESNNANQPGQYRNGNN